jgi:hypothetical protein
VNGLVVVGCPSAAVVVRELVGTGRPVPAVITTSAHAARAVASLPTRLRPGEVLGADERDLPERLSALPVDYLLDVFGGPALSIGALDHLPTVHVRSGRQPEGLPGDPVARAILDGQEVLPVVCSTRRVPLRLDPDRSADAVAVELAEHVAGALERLEVQGGAGGPARAARHAGRDG